MRSHIVPASYVDAVRPADGNKVKVLDASPEEVAFGLDMQVPSICEALLRRNNLALASVSNAAYSNKINILPVSDRSATSDTMYRNCPERIGAVSS